MSDGGMVGDRQGGIPDLTEPIVGYRTLQLKTGSMSLFSPYRSTEWKRPFLEALCVLVGMYGIPSPRPGGHRAPSPNCQCGIYAYHTLADMRSVTGQCVVCLVSLTGNVEVHRDGMRAARCRVHALAPPDVPNKGPKDMDRVRAIAGAWRVPVLSEPRDLVRLAPEYGRPLPHFLLPLDD